jgi:arylformamidase
MSGDATRALIDGVAGMTIVDLSHRIEPGMPVFPTHPQYFSMEWETHDPAAMNLLLVGEHVGTHVDSPSHFYPEKGDARNVSIADASLRLAVGRAVKLDFRGVDPSHEVGADELREWEERHGRVLGPDDAVVFDFGHAERWGTFDAAADYLAAWPGVSREGAELLVERGVRAVGTDCLGIDRSATSDLGAHFVLLERGIAIVENLCSLDRVPDEFLLLALPLKIAGGTGSPVRAVALFAEPGDG